MIEVPGKVLASTSDPEAASILIVGPEVAAEWLAYGEHRHADAWQPQAWRDVLSRDDQDEDHEERYAAAERMLLGCALSGAIGIVVVREGAAKDFRRCHELYEVDRSFASDRDLEVGEDEDGLAFYLPGENLPCVSRFHFLWSEVEKLRVPVTKDRRFMKLLTDPVPFVAGPRLATLSGIPVSEPRLTSRLGRPGRDDKEPEAAFTMRLLDMPAEELTALKGKRLWTLLQWTYEQLKLSPPAERNARPQAESIRRAVLARRAQP